MATAVHIPVEEYLHTSYEPDRDYVDGELVERPSGEEWHSSVQLAIGAIFRANRAAWRLRAYTEQRVQVLLRASSFRTSAWFRLRNL